MKCWKNIMARPGIKPESLKSLNFMTRSYVRFHNNTRRFVDVVWINYEGTNVKYRTLSPGGFVDVNTYVTHPWIFIDSETKDRLVVKSEEVYNPEPWFNRYLGIPRHEITQQQVDRINVYITIPLFTLRQNALQVIRNLLKSPEHAYTLELPIDLQHELATLVRQSNQTPFGVLHNE